MSRSTSTIAFAVLALVAGASAQPFISVWDGLKAQSQFSRSVEAYEKAGLDQILKNPQFIGTMFIPTNAAWDIYLMASQQKFDFLGTPRLTDIMKYSIFNNVALETNKLTNGLLLTSSGGRVATILKSGDLITVAAESYSNSPISSPSNLKICNVVIHAVSWPIIPSNQVLSLSPPPAFVEVNAGPQKGMPQALTKLKDVSIALALLKQHVDLWNTTAVQDGSLISTWFLPTDNAMIKFFATKSYNQNTIGKARATALLLNHVVAGDASPTAIWKSGDKFFTQLTGKFVTVNKGLAGVITVSATTTAKIINANNAAGNALFHLLDNVLVPAGAGV